MPRPGSLRETGSFEVLPCLHLDHYKMGSFAVLLRLNLAHHKTVSSEVLSCLNLDRCEKQNTTLRLHEAAPCMHNTSLYMHKTAPVHRSAALCMHRLPCACIMQLCVHTTAMRMHKTALCLVHAHSFSPRISLFLVILGGSPLSLPCLWL